MGTANEPVDVLAETFDVFEEFGPGTPLTTSEVSTHLDCSRRATYDRLERLVEQGEIETKKVGARGRVWWRPPEVRPGDGDRSRTDDGGDQTGTDDDTGRSGADATNVGVGASDAESGVEDSSGNARRTDEPDDASPSESDEGGERSDVNGSGGSLSRLSEDRPGMVYRCKAESGWPMSFVSDGSSDVTGYEPLTLESEGVRWDGDVVHPADRQRFHDRIEELLASGSRYTLQYRILTAGGETRWVRDAGRVVDEEGSTPILEGRIVHVADRDESVSNRESGREEMDEVFERIDDAFCAFDDEFRFTYLNERAKALLQHSEEELLGRTGWETFPGSAATPLWDAFHTALETQEAISFEHYVDGWRLWVEVNVYPSETGLSVYFRDISEQKEFEQTLTALHETSRELLAAGTKSEVSDTVVGAATDVLDFDGVVVYRYDDERNLLTPDARSMESDVDRGEFPEIPADEGTVTGRAFVDGEARRYDDLQDASVDRAEGTEMRAGLFVPMGDHGIVVAGAREAGSFEDRTLQLLEILAANAEATYDRVERERKLARQRERLAALDELNAVVREITEALIEQSTREEIESVVCERLADAASYEFAWIGEVGRRDDEVIVRTEAGVGDRLDDLAVSVAPDQPGSDSPTARALRTREMQVATDGDGESADEQWLRLARDRGFRSMAAIPVSYEDVLYGVLNVYASRSGAFAGEERAVIGQLGDVVGHAINAIERKQALMTDDVTEVQFRLRNVFEEYGFGSAADGTVSYEELIPVGNGEFLMYGTATEEAIDAVESFEDRIPDIDEVTILGRQDGETRFEQRMSEPPVISQVAAQGGDVRSATIEEGDYYLTVHLPPNVDVRDVIETAEAVYPPIEMVTRRQVSRSSGGDPNQRKLDVGHPFLADLSDRQRAAVLAAYHSGFFEWPRESSGEDVADSLDVSPSTFHQHVRIAEKKLLESVLADRPT